MKTLSIVLVVFAVGTLFSCKKGIDVYTPVAAPAAVSKISADTISAAKKCGNSLQTSFARKIDSIQRKQNSPKPSLGNTAQCVSTVTEVIYLDFNGQTLTGTLWNDLTGQAVIACPSVMNQLTATQRTVIVANVQERYSQFDVLVTTDQTKYNNAPANARTRVIITRGMNSIFPMAAGYSFIGSLSWGMETPCIIMADNLGYSVPDIIWNIEHESGHAVVLGHQSLWVNGVLQYVYHPVTGLGSWDATGKIMGTCYQANIVGWADGLDELGDPQHDTELLGYYLGFKPDDITSIVTVTAGTTYKQFLSDEGDVDMFQWNKKVGKITITGFNCDMEVLIYNANGYQETLDDPTRVGISPRIVTANSGNKLTFYVRAKNPSTANISTIRQGGGYSLKVTN